jgi:hypothetical protein
MSGLASGTNNAISPYALAKALDDCAKRWWGASLGAKGLGFLTGALISVLPPEPIPFIVAGYTIVAELCSYRSDTVKNSAQQFRRKLDLQDGFGWPIPNADLSDLLVRCSAWVKQRARTHPVGEPYFASTDPPGPLRALKNVCESAWWTKHLAQRMATYCWTAMILGIIISFIVMIVVIQATSTHSTQVNVAKMVTAFLMLFLSLGLVKLALGYGSLGKNSESSEKAADRAQQGTPDELGAFKVMYDYHLNRAAGPLLPTWLWNMRKDDLNQSWRELRNGAGHRDERTL